VTIDTCTFAACHDGIELAASTIGATIGFTMSDCWFVAANWEQLMIGVENGLEIVGTGSIAYSVDNCKFLACFNIPGQGGTWLPGLAPPGQPPGQSTGGIVDRSAGGTSGIVRACDFRNFAWGILTSENTPLDMGNGGDLGLNNFCLDYTDFPVDLMGNATNPFRVALMDNSNIAVQAEGNHWLRNNQHANGTGFMTITGDSGAMVNLPNMTGIGGTAAMPGPPGPLWHEFPTGSAIPFDRNYSIFRKPSMGIGQIVFGSFDPGAGPDCSADPVP
jgi:hypothetical protein